MKKTKKMCLSVIFCLKNVFFVTLHAIFDGHYVYSYKND